MDAPRSRPLDDVICAIARRVIVVAFGVSLCETTATGQQLLDRVVARVNGQAITLTDTRAAVGFGLVQVVAGADPVQAAAEALIDRQLVVAQVERFPPPDPSPAEVDAAAAALKTRAGDAVLELQRTTGVDDHRLREIARETLRIDAYLDQRFGTARRRDAVAQWLRDLRNRADIARPLYESRQPPGPTS